MSPLAAHRSTVQLTDACTTSSMKHSRSPCIPSPKHLLEDRILHVLYSLGRAKRSHRCPRLASVCRPRRVAQSVIWTLNRPPRRRKDIPEPKPHNIVVIASESYGVTFSAGRYGKNGCERSMGCCMPSSLNSPPTKAGTCATTSAIPAALGQSASKMLPSFTSDSEVQRYQ